MGAIYKITNKINGKIYIGKTERENPEIRWQEHLRHANKLDLPLYRAINKYGKENFCFEVIEQCNNFQLDEREIYWIAYHNSYGEKGYNCTGGGEGGIKDYHEHIQEIMFRYKQGERLDKLCKEFHYDYASIRPKLVALGLDIDTHAGPKKMSKKIIAVSPYDGKSYTYNSISEAARAICEPGHNPASIHNGLRRNRDTGRVYHGFLWYSEETGL